MKLSRAAELAADDPVEFVGPERDVVSWPSLGEMGIVARSEDRGIRVLWERSTMMMAWPREWVRLARAEPEESSPRSSND